MASAGRRTAAASRTGQCLLRHGWRARSPATLAPEHEIPFRRTVPAHLWTEPGAEPIYARAAHEAGLTLPDGGDKR